jgi:hypothetical protein
LGSIEYDIQLQEVIDDMGMEIYAAYPEGRHEAATIVIIGFITLLFGEYLKGFFDFEALGKKTREAFNSLFDTSTTAGKTTPKTAVKHITEALSSLLEAGAQPNADAGSKAITQITSFLVSKGIPEATAKIRAEKIAASIKKQLKL